jgi:hypothetical protein
MNADSLAKWTLDDVKAHCRRFGLTLPDDHLARMHELSETVSSTGLGIPRMPGKDAEPALVFCMPMR